MCKCLRHHCNNYLYYSHNKITSLLLRKLVLNM